MDYVCILCTCVLLSLGPWETVTLQNTDKCVEGLCMYIMYMCPDKSWTLGDSYFAEYRQMCRRIMYVYYVHVSY
jgi:hypothetical protein